MRAWEGAGALVGVAALLGAIRADAQPGRFARPPPVVEESPPSPPVVVAVPVSPSADLKSHVGAEIGARLLRSSDADERLRGIRRLAELGTAQSVALLIDAVRSDGPARKDARALVEVARALAPAVDQVSARLALKSIVEIPFENDNEDPDVPARVDLARQIAAFAIAQSSQPHPAELAAIARTPGPGANAAFTGLLGTPQTPAPVANATANSLRLAGALGDLRTADSVRTAARASDPMIRAAALAASGELGDTRVLDLARAALVDLDPRVRTAAAEALVQLGAPDAPRAVEALLGADVTALAGTRLAERAADLGVARALAARAMVTQNRTVRAAAVAALGRNPTPDSVHALTTFLESSELQSEAAAALGRSPSAAAMGAIETAAGRDGTRRLAVRAYVVRALMRGERSRAMDEIVRALAGASEPAARALGVFARVALGDAGAAEYLAEKDPRVRRAAIMAASAAPSAHTARALLARHTVETDERTRQLLAIGLLEGDPGAMIKTGTLEDRAASGGPDAPLAAMELARRADDGHAEKVWGLLESSDPVMRQHVARGLALAPVKDASGRLALAWRYEGDPGVRRAIVLALARRTQDRDAPARRGTLEEALARDPDARVRWIAARALAGKPPEPRGAPTPEVVWLKIEQPGGARPVGAPYAGALVRADGIAVPLVFDDDGYALIPGVPPGEARLVLAPRIPSYEPDPR